MAGAEDRQWPPRSPYEAILSSPSGRKKLEQRRRQQLSPSPSPSKRFRGAAPNTLMVAEPVVRDEDEDDEDEETIQLQLQALEAKLKLKRLQNKKAKGRTLGNEQDAEIPARVPSVLEPRRNGVLSTAALHRSKSVGDIQIPVSPERRPIVQQEQKSPGRVLLGIDKGLTARNVSLRRAPSLRSGILSKDDPFGGDLRPSQAARNGALSSRYLVPENGNAPTAAAPMSFNERMSQVRDKEKTDKERQDRMAKLRAERSTGFGVRKEEIAAFKEAAEAAPRTRRPETQHTDDRALSREDILKAANKPAGGLVRRSNTTSALPAVRANRAPSSSAQSRPGSVATAREEQAKHSRSGSISLSDDSRPSTPADPGLFEGYSRTNLSNRVLPHSFVSRMVEDKTPVTLPVLLKEVKAPDFTLPPELEEKDLVVFATIAAKSEPRAHKQTHHQPAKTNALKSAAEEAAESEANENGNYMIFTLTDLKWSVELFLFKTAYTRWHKLQPGTVVAILNPSIMPPPKGRADTGRWSLTLNSSDDTVLEIGTSKDLGWCKAKTKDGRDCSDWVDTRKTEFCDYHVNRSVEGLRRGRMEVQGMSAPFGPGGKSGGGNGYLNSLRGKRGNQNSSKEDGLLKEGRQFDRYTQSSYFMVPRSASTASLLDADENTALHGGSKEERQRRIFAAEEKEREIARKLGQAQFGAGAEYLRARNGDVLPASSRPVAEQSGRSFDATALGLRSNRAENVRLSPLKRKKPSSIRNGSSSRGTHGDGRGGGSGSGDAEAGPQKKKTRFITEKGIREAGRDSLGGEDITSAMRDDCHDDDDGLDIV